MIENVVLSLLPPEYTQPVVRPGELFRGRILPNTFKVSPAESEEGVLEAVSTSVPPEKFRGKSLRELSREINQFEMGKKYQVIGSVGLNEAGEVVSKLCDTAFTDSLILYVAALQVPASLVR